MSEAASRKSLQVNPPVFFISGGLLVAFMAFGVFFDEVAIELFSSLLDFVSSTFGWLYVLAVAFFIVFAGWLLFGPYAGLRLGRDEERPEFSRPTWFAMLFSAGMGIGLVFYGVAEPVMHFASPPRGQGGTLEAARAALPTTFFHWGLHAWAIYALMGLAIAYFSFRRGLPLALRSCLYPLFGDRIYGSIGHAVDILAVFGTLFGLATSLGLGAMQVSAGLHHLFDIPHTTGTQLVLIAVITVIATISLVTGVKKGIRRLSELNLILAGLLLLFVLGVGPTGFILSSFIENVGRYAGELVTRSFAVGALADDDGTWIKSWTFFYWGWWIAWAPFVGMFVARISRGRTIREFILGVLLVPTAVTFFWMTVFGGTAIYLELETGAPIAAAVKEDVATAIYVTLEQLPLSSITSLLAALVVAVFFVTSSDSASFVVDMLTSGGHPNPPKWQRVFWATAEGATAAVLLYAGGPRTLQALQAAVVSIGLPFCLVLLAIAWSLARALRQEAAKVAPRPLIAPKRRRAPPPLEESMQLQKILVPVDFSPHSERAVQHALGLADLVSDGTRIDLLHVARRPVDYLPLDLWIWGEERKPEELDAKVLEAAEGALSEFVERFDGDGKEHLRPRVVLGLPSQVIVDLIEQEKYDLTVLGTHGAAGTDRLEIGSVTERVVRNAACPVVTVS